GKAARVRQIEAREGEAVAQGEIGPPGVVRDSAEEAGASRQPGAAEIQLEESASSRENDGAGDLLVAGMTCEWHRQRNGNDEADEHRDSPHIVPARRPGSSIDYKGRTTGAPAGFCLQRRLKNPL